MLDWPWRKCFKQVLIQHETFALKSSATNSHAISNLYLRLFEIPFIFLYKLNFYKGLNFSFADLNTTTRTIYSSSPSHLTTIQKQTYFSLYYCMTYTLHIIYFICIFNIIQFTITSQQDIILFIVFINNHYSYHLYVLWRQINLKAYNLKPLD